MTEYLEDGTYVPLIGEMQVAEDNIWFHGDQGLWSVSDRQHAIDTLVSCTNFSDGYDELVEEGQSMAAKWTFANAGEKSLPVFDMLKEMNDARSHVTA